MRQHSILPEYITKFSRIPLKSFLLYNYYIFNILLGGENRKYVQKYKDGPCL